ncbi:hypothetical protein E0E50_09305 [Azotobacter chroococcum subsp. isscasi]|uniref:hypothetical protein n=1 Tax=Azotobacter chroococcum TaxID=353 RepID=UPI001040C753|nr:hypothetical protein [Azotobacter chroococcum]TBW10755.1 hypothetical protein E0E50_09305 [Azotobacter chroococcum subsp. isscasi]
MGFALLVFTISQIMPGLILSWESIGYVLVRAALATKCRDGDRDFVAIPAENVVFVDRNQ